MKRFLVFAFLLVVLCACLANGNLPIKVFAQEEFSVDAKSAILVDYASGEVLLGQNIDTKLEIASMVKLMTIYLTVSAVEQGEISLDDFLTVSEHASSMGGSQVFLDAGEKYNVGKMLQSVIMASANDASVALSEYISGSEKAFVEKMNQTAVQLGMNNTLYANATGLPAPMQYSTAYDTSIILSKLVSNDIYHNFSSLWMDELVHPSGRKTELVNTNKLTRYYKGCDSGKTGFTDEALYCLASSAVRDDMRLVAVVMGAKTANQRFGESVKLLNYGFDNFKSETIIDTEVCLGEISVVKSTLTSAKVFAKDNFASVVKKGQKHEYEISVNIDKKVVAPSLKGEKVGEIVVSKQGVVVKEIDLVLGQDIDALTFGQAFRKVSQAW
ncbi:MAG: D-alanyl-D-alanine carboxypeptidase [Clostridia bacterium]|nr:D-alanyl-D-alanine carboxypeptidase [Clostridia bacterium]